MQSNFHPHPVGTNANRYVHILLKEWLPAVMHTPELKGYSNLVSLWLFENKIAQMKLKIHSLSFFVKGIDRVQEEMNDYYKLKIKGLIQTISWYGQFDAPAIINKIHAFITFIVIYITSL